MMDASQVAFKTLTTNAARDAVRMFFLPITKLWEFALSWKQNPSDSQATVALQQVYGLQAQIANLEVQLQKQQEAVALQQADQFQAQIANLEAQLQKQQEAVIKFQAAESARLIENLEARLSEHRKITANSQARLVREFDSRLRTMQAYKPDYSTSSAAERSSSYSRPAFGSRPGFGYVKREFGAAKPPAKKKEELKVRPDQIKYVVEQRPEGGFIIKLPQKGQVGSIYPTHELALEHAQKFNLSARPKTPKFKIRKNDKI